MIFVWKVSPSKMMVQVVKEAIKECKKEHKKSKDYKDCVYCTWWLNGVCKYGKYTKRRAEE